MRTLPRKPIEDLDTLPLPAVDLFDTERYIRRFVQLDSYDPGLRGMSLIVSRGCPFDCAFCQPGLRALFGPRVRFRSPARVVEDIRALVAAYRLEAIYFQDDTLTISSWMAEFCALMIRDNPGVVWACNTRADTVTRETLALMRAAGCVKIKVGIESASDRVRNGILGKRVSRESIDLLLRNCRDLGIQAAGFFMLGSPTETIREAWSTVLFAARADLAEANFSITVPLPGTTLHDRAKREGWTLPATYGAYDYYQVSRPRFTGTDPGRWTLVAMKKVANLLFYLHPRRFRATCRQILSPAGIRKLAFKLRRL